MPSEMRQIFASTIVFYFSLSITKCQYPVSILGSIACRYNFLVFLIDLDLDGFFIGDIQVESPRVGENVKTYNISLDSC